MKPKAKSTLRNILSESKPILKEMGINPDKIKYKFERSGEKHIPRGYTGFSHDVDKNKKVLYIASNRPVQTIVRTIAHESKHLADPKAQKRNVGEKAAERKAISFENRFVKVYRKTYYE